MTAPSALHRPPGTHIEVSINYAGITKPFSVTPSQTVNSLLELALNAFGIHNNRHTQALFTEAGVELADAQSITDASIKDGDTLLLRPSKVKGGAQ